MAARQIDGTLAQRKEALDEKAAAAAESRQLKMELEKERAALQQAQAQLGSSIVPPAAPTPHLDAEETQCVVCFDAPKDHIIVPCYHLCVCEACANLLTQMEQPSCPICRTAIQQTNKVFHS